MGQYNLNRIFKPRHVAVVGASEKECIGFSHFVSIGSMLDVDFGDMIDYLGNDSSAKSILLYIESLTNFRKFMSAARSVSRVKPIIVLKSGRSLAGAKAAASHTGALAGEDAVYDAAFKRAGIVLRENRNMLALGKKLGFEIKRDPDSGDNELVIHFEGNRLWTQRF